MSSGDNQDRSQESGFTLVEMAIALFITGILISGALLSASQYIRAEKVSATKAKIAFIQQALSSYAQQHYRLPCPADPGAGIGGNTQIPGQEVDNGSCFQNASNAGLYWETEGIVPWKELGIPQDMVIDAWKNYITYKPAPQLTVNTISDKMLDAANNDNASLDIQNACRTAMWYAPTAEHVNRAKALFCCNASPKANYIAATPGMSALSADWRRNGVVDTTTAQATATSGSSLPSATPVHMTSNWMDDASYANTHGSFSSGFNRNYPEPPLLRATGLAVTLISHGADSNLAFLQEQSKNKLFGGATVSTNGGLSNSTSPAVENYNVWPPHIFSGVFGHPRVNDGSYDPINGGAKASDDLVSYMRSDNLFGLVGQASCEKPPAAVFQPEQPCAPIHMQLTSNTFDPKNGVKVTMNTIDMEIQQNSGQPMILQAAATRLSDDAGYNNSLGVFTIGSDGTIQSVRLLTANMHDLQLGQSATSTQPVAEDGTAVGTFILANGETLNSTYLDQTVTDPKTKAQIPNPNLIDPNSLKMMYHYGQSDARAATVADANSDVSLVATVASTNQTVKLYGANNDSTSGYTAANGNGIESMYSTMNFDQVDHGWRSGYGLNANSVLKNGGVDPNDDTKINAGFEDLSKISCYYTASGSCVSTKPPKPTDPDHPKPTDAALDQYGGFIANIGDNDYDDVSASMSMTQCPQSN